MPRFGYVVQESKLQSVQGSQGSHLGLNEPQPALDGLSTSTGPVFKNRGFYLHGGWTFNYPFAVRSWSRDDYRQMFKLLKSMGYDQVGLWPLLEAIPTPLSEEDAEAIKAFRLIIEDARATRLDAWLILCPNLTSEPSIADQPWANRNPWNTWDIIHLDDPEQAKPFLSHRTSMLSILNNADAYVTIDGDPGGYPGAEPEDYLKVFISDRAAIDKYGINPSEQYLIPWIWCGWGTSSVWGGNPNNPPSLIRPYTGAAMELLKKEMPEPWKLLPGRSHRENWANGRLNVLLADSLGLMGRSTIFCYEAIEFEPTPPATILQFDHIRRILKEEAVYAGVAEGVFGNAQQPIIVLPNLYFFARGSMDLSYLNKADHEVLKDFAEFLGGPEEILVPAWDCLRLNLESLPEELPQHLRNLTLTGEPANYIPGSAEMYLEILGKQVEARIGLLKSIARPVGSSQQAAENLASAITALIDWWRVHGYMRSDDTGGPFKWTYVPQSQLAPLHSWCLKNIEDPEAVKELAAKILVGNNVLPESYCQTRLNELFSQ